MYDNEEGHNNNDRQRTNFDQNSSLEPLWAKKDIGNITETVLENEEVNTMNKKEIIFLLWANITPCTYQKTQGSGRERRQSQFHCYCLLGWIGGEHCCSRVEHAHCVSLHSDWNAQSRCCFDYDEDDLASFSLKTVQSHVSRVNIW